MWRSHCNVGRAWAVVLTTTSPSVATGVWSSRVFTGGLFVLLPGTREYRIAPQNAAALAERFRKAGFFKLRRSYRLAATDLPTYVLTIDAGQRHKSVEDYGGSRAVGMPKAVTDLEQAVDEVAGTDRWIRGSAGLTAWLEGQKLRFPIAGSGATATQDFRIWPTAADLRIAANRQLL
jgi:hypothetical protein